ncbi:hypothetical protein H1235_00080 [Pseudoxanthomonas sp. NC8]|nr:hypothetical protein H1235_00080 [Pseudoxanthomonas sp. NC8]
MLDIDLPGRHRGEFFVRHLTGAQGMGDLAVRRRVDDQCNPRGRGAIGRTRIHVAQQHHLAVIRMDADAGFGRVRGRRRDQQDKK